MRLALMIAVVSLAASAQAQSATLTLDEAISLARRNNPMFQAAVNARRSADMAVRSAYANFLPSVGASMSGRYQNAGNQFVSGVALGNASDVVQSSYGIGVNYSINSAVLFAPKLVGAQRDAAEADVTGGAELLRATVTQEYIGVLQAQARAALQDSLLATTKGQLDLNRARQAVGAATILDVRTAEVAYGQAEVRLLQARNAADVALLRLFERIGVAQPDNVVLSTRFPIAPMTLRLDSLQDLARQTNPGLNALRSREKAASLNVKARAGQYAPTLSFSTGWGGNTQALTSDAAALSRATSGFLGSVASCYTQDSLRSAVAGMARLPCGALTFTAADSAAVLDNNNKFPFNFTNAPRSFSVQLSMPLFDNLGREQQVQQARIDHDNVRFTVRQRELQLRADVREQYLNVTTAQRTVEMQEVNAQLAREQLAFAEERYRVGAATFLDVTTSRGVFEQAQIDRLNAIYDYHRAFAALENAVGRPLR